MLRDSRYRQDQPETDTEQDTRPDLRAYQLVAHEKQRSARDFFERSLMAAFLLECLRTIGFFGDSKLDEKGTDNVTVSFNMRLQEEGQT